MSNSIDLGDANPVAISWTWKPEATDGRTELVGVKVVEQVCDCANAGRTKLTLAKTALTGFMVGC